MRENQKEVGGSCKLQEFVDDEWWVSIRGHACADDIDRSIAQVAFSKAIKNSKQDDQDSNGHK
jgi:hypothetical protein